MAKVQKVETPLLRVSRPVSACQRCRNAKVRCDGKLPACTACERAGRSNECSSANDQFARGKERSYVASLENRIDKLQRQITEAKARKGNANALDMVSAQPLLAPPFLQNGGGGRMRRKEAQDVSDLVSDFGFLSVNATARDFHGFTQQMSFARLVSSTSSTEVLPNFTVNMLPQRHAISPLIQYYLDNVHALYPFLSETKLFAAVAAVYQGSGDHPATPMDHWTTRMVLAISLASWSRSRGDTQHQDAVRHAAGAFEYIEDVVQPGCLTGIQAMLLMVIYALLDPHHFKAWNLIGLASRAMVDIGMHQDPPTDSRSNEHDREMRRRVYATIYSLDRSISMVYRRSFSFTDDSANITSTIRSIQSHNDNQLFLHNFDAAVEVDRLRLIQSAHYQKLFYSSRSDLRSAWPQMSRALADIHQWAENLPDRLQKPLKRVFRCDVLYSSVLILSPPDLQGNIYDYGKFLIFEYAAEYAELMVWVSSSQEPPIFTTHHDVLRTSFVAERLIYTLLNSTMLLFGGVMPKVPLGSVPPSGPSTLPIRTVGEMVNKAYRCLDHLGRSMELLGPKYGHSETLAKFKAQSNELRHTLQVIYDSWSKSIGVSRGE